MKKTIGLLCSLVLLIGCILPINQAFAEENSDGNNEEMVQVVLYSNEDQIIMSEVPKIYEQEYLAKLEDPNFKKAEIQKSLGVNALPETASVNAVVPYASPKPYVSYMKLPDVIKHLAAMDKSFNWSLYISNPLTDAVIGKAVSFITKKSIIGWIAGVMTWTASWVMSKQEAWWKDSEIMILRKQIKGVKLTVTPNNTGSNYPAAYITLTRY